MTANQCASQKRRQRQTNESGETPLNYFSLLNKVQEGVDDVKLVVVVAGIVRVFVFRPWK